MTSAPEPSPKIFLLNHPGGFFTILPAHFCPRDPPDLSKNTQSIVPTLTLWPICFPCGLFSVDTFDAPHLTYTSLSELLWELTGLHGTFFSCFSFIRGTVCFQLSASVFLCSHDCYPDITCFGFHTRMMMSLTDPICYFPCFCSLFSKHLAMSLPSSPVPIP